MQKYLALNLQTTQAQLTGKKVLIKQPKFRQSVSEEKPFAPLESTLIDTRGLISHEMEQKQLGFGKGKVIKIKKKKELTSNVQGLLTSN